MKPLRRVSVYPVRLRNECLCSQLTLLLRKLQLARCLFILVTVFAVFLLNNLAFLIWLRVGLIESLPLLESILEHLRLIAIEDEVEGHAAQSFLTFDVEGD